MDSTVSIFHIRVLHICTIFICGNTRIKKNGIDTFLRSKPLGIGSIGNNPYISRTDHSRFNVVQHGKVSIHHIGNTYMIAHFPVVVKEIYAIVGVKSRNQVGCFHLHREGSNIRGLFDINVFFDFVAIGRVDNGNTFARTKQIVVSNFTGHIRKIKSGFITQNLMVFARLLCIRHDDFGAFGCTDLHFLRLDRLLCHSAYIAIHLNGSSLFVGR